MPSLCFLFSRACDNTRSFFCFVWRVSQAALAQLYSVGRIGIPVRGASSRGERGRARAERRQRMRAQERASFRCAVAGAGAGALGMNAHVCIAKS